LQSMISQTLRSKFHILEMVAFQEWKTATPERQRKITRRLARFEARMIMQEIEEQVRIKINTIDNEQKI